MSGLTLDQTQQVQHVARLAVLAMCARGVAGAEFEISPEIGEVYIVVRRAPAVGDELPCEIEFIDVAGHPFGGIAL